jgi:hypothetical protein
MEVELHSLKFNVTFRTLYPQAKHRRYDAVSTSAGLTVDINRKIRNLLE